METIRKYEKIYLGSVKGKGRIYLTPPSWDCGWYWGFGYLGNSRNHYHVDGLKEKITYHHVGGEKPQIVRDVKRMCLCDGFKQEFGKSFIVKDDEEIWKLAELFETFYLLRETAELFGRGGCNVSENPLSGLLKNEECVNKINSELLPQVFEQIYRILEKWNGIRLAKKEEGFN